ncbi:3-phosphoshikimate 1-carboxyvinyltransferase [Clostridium tunisiense]|uniref:3-phosphoshikimate 1-carboxyvinyltransferase n=1 Tax=Clostridium tunisiense TaxID=219748 RepID=UPI0002DCAF51|nr:3-phosphoshikimate 1-carboxyvinyltransferase [Clostridium tunisiense]
MKAILKGCKSNCNIEITIPGDKSISHRSLIIGAIPEGSYTIRNFSNSEDCRTTTEVMKVLGVSIVSRENQIMVNSPGIHRFNKNVGMLDCGNSGTTARLISGLICGGNIAATLIGDESLSKRPMKRVVDPLTSMGGKIKNFKGTLPINFISNQGLSAIEYEMPVPSAQVKSAILIGGFLAKGKTKVIEKISTRNHTENLFEYLGANVTRTGSEISIENSSIQAKDIFVPGDPSSASFLVCAALLGDNIKLTIKNLLLNEGRKSYLNILKAMGGKIEIVSKGIVNNEPIGDIIVYSSKLKGIKIQHDLVPSIIDEIPVLSVVAAFAEGTTVFEGVEELKFKESNRVAGIVSNLKVINIEVIYKDKDLIIKGANNVAEKLEEKNIEIKTDNDHRIAMAFSLLPMKLKTTIIIDNWQCTEISFPNATTYFSKFINFIK